MGHPTDGSLEDLCAELLRLELAVARRDRPALPDGYDGVLHPDFHETGASGRWWTRDAMMTALEGAPASDLAIERFEIEVLADGVVLATYETPGERPARRASIWARHDGRWRLRFHQGTLI